MDKYELETWLMSLSLQTLTTELKREIWENIEETIHNEIINTH